MKLSLTQQQMVKARRVLRDYYDPDTVGTLTDAEIVAELSSLRRKRDKGTLDDRGHEMVAALSIGDDPLIS